MALLRLKAHYYEQFDADFALDVPGEGYGGWRETQVELAREHTAVVVMHVWDAGTREDYPGWHRAVEYIPRSYGICRRVLPPLLAAVRAAGTPLAHVVGGGGYYKDLAGYRAAVELAGPEPPSPEQVKGDEVLEALQRLRYEKVFPGAHNQPDIARGSAALDFPDEAQPMGDEAIAENGHQLGAWCRSRGVNHLIYAGFAANWCLLMSPGGMMDMSRRGAMCSIFRDATTAVENRETARLELHKEEALWRVCIAFGFVFDTEDFIAAVRRL